MQWLNINISDMSISKSTYFFVIVVIVLASAVVILLKRLKAVTDDRDIQRKNVEVLFADVSNYKVRDSLNAATIGELQLSLSQYKKFRAEDAALIADLKLDNKRLNSVVSTQSENYYRKTVELRDSLIHISRNLHDSIKVPIFAKVANYSDKWHTLLIAVQGDSVSYSLKTMEQLLIVNHVVPKRFLFFKWGCKEIKTDVVSKSPYCKDVRVESITIR